MPAFFMVVSHVIVGANMQMDLFEQSSSGSGRRMLRLIYVNEHVGPREPIFVANTTDASSDLLNRFEEQSRLT